MLAAGSQEVIGLYEQHAADFDRLRGRGLMEKPWLDRFIALLPQKASVLDIGCGAAEPIARYVIDNGHNVTGIDASSSLIHMCRQRFPQNQWVVADMRQLALGRRYDGLIAWHSLFHLTPQDQREMFKIFQAHAAEGAALLFTAGPRHGENTGCLEGKPLYHASLDFQEYEALLAQNGFRIVQHKMEDAACGGATVYLASRNAG